MRSRAALKIDEGSAQAHYLMGLCLDALKKPEQAKVSLHRAVELSPALLDAREKLADLHRQTDHADDEIIQLEGLRTLDPGSPSRHVSLGLALAEAGQLDRSVAILAATAERFPTDAYTFVALGRVWLEAAQTRDDPVLLQKAVEALERGVSGDASSEALMLLGKALLQGGKPERASTVLLEATTKKPVEPLAFSYLADAAEQIGNPAMARDALLGYNALEGDPTDPRRRGQLFQRIADLSVRSRRHAGGSRLVRARRSGRPVARRCRVPRAPGRRAAALGRCDRRARQRDKSPRARAGQPGSASAATETSLTRCS